MSDPFSEKDRSPFFAFFAVSIAPISPLSALLIPANHLELTSDNVYTNLSPIFDDGGQTCVSGASIRSKSETQTRVPAHFLYLRSKVTAIAEH